MSEKNLAPGVTPAEGFIPLIVPEVRGNEWKYVKECLDTNWVSSVGAFVNRFEQMMASYVGCARAVATVNGTAALQVSLRIAGVRPDDEVLVSDLTFIAPVNTIRYLGAWPVFIDAEADYWQMDPEKVRDFLEKQCSWKNGCLRNTATDRRVSALLPVHILGHPVDMDPILEVARKYDLKVIEDATESLGAKYKGRMVGTLGDIACFSYNGNKIITTGGGGMIVTDNEAWAEKARYLTTQAKDDPLEYIHNEIGYNYRLTNVLAAMGVAQMEKLDEYVAAKRRIAQYYAEQLRGIAGLSLMSEASWAWSTYWMYTVLIDAGHYGIDSRELLRKFAAAKIQTRPLWQPIHASPAYKNIAQADCPVAERLCRDALSLPCSVGITEAELERVVCVVKE
ncbi:MAG: LegC family aminotransferase [Thermoguttaceae bacterium]